jgi:thiamine phosphate synthase YjbQ (UPF0047 family)
VKSFRKELWFEVPGRRAFLNITPEVETCVRESGVKEGLVLVNAMHITASVFINDDMKRQVMGREVVVAVTQGKLDFGPWEQIFYGEFDGGRRKRALIKIIGE